MPIGCNDSMCGCSFESETLSIVRVGDTVTLEQTEFEVLTQLENAVANILAALDLLPGTYVLKVGDTATGTIVVNGSGASFRAMRDDDNPWIEWTQQDGDRIAFIQGATTLAALRLVAEAGYDIRFDTDGGDDRMWILRSTGIVAVGKSSSAIGSNGVEAQPTGSVWSTRSTTGQNFRSNKTGAGNADGEVHFRVDNAGTQIGTITRATSTTTGFNTTSDEEQKQNIVEIPDELALLWLEIIVPYLYDYRDFPHRPSNHAVHVGYIAQRVAASWPESVALGVVRVGHGRIGERSWDADGNETTPDDVWRGWEFDYTKIPPYTHAALRAVRRQQLADAERISALEEWRAAIDARDMRD